MLKQERERDTRVIKQPVHAGADFGAMREHFSDAVVGDIEAIGITLAGDKALDRANRHALVRDAVLLAPRAEGSRQVTERPCGALSVRLGRRTGKFTVLITV